MKKNKIKKVIWKIRGFLIKLIANKDMTIIINTELDSKKGIVIISEYNVFKNIDINGFDTKITVNVDWKDDIKPTERGK